MENTQLSLFGKTSAERSPQIKERTFASSSKSSAKLKTKPLQFLDLRSGGANGILSGALWQTDSPSLGEYWTLNIGESPKDEEESFLWQILEANVPTKYYLSETACRGVLRRAENRGKDLPKLLHLALLLQANLPKEELMEKLEALSGG